MKTKFATAIGILMTFSSGLLQAAPWDYLPIPPPPHVVIERRFREREREYRNDDRCDRGGGYVRDDRYDRGASSRDYCPGFWDRTEVRAQVRLQKLGYYCGAVDGCFGYGSQRALMRFQLDRDLAVTGRLDRCTLAALRIY